MLYDFTCMRDLEQSDSETESGMDGGRQGLGKEQMGTSCFGGDRVAVLQDARSSGAGGGGGCSTVRSYLTPPSCALKNGHNGHKFYVYFSMVF